DPRRERVPSSPPNGSRRWHPTLSPRVAAGDVMVLTMTQQQPPAAIGALIDATNAGDTKAFVAAFTDDAYVRDGNREFTGHEGVGDWDRTDNIGVGMRFELLSWRATGPDSYVVTINAASRRFNGTGDLRLTLRGAQISRLEVG